MQKTCDVALLQIVGGIDTFTGEREEETVESCIQLRMLFAEQTGETGPLVVMLHWLGGSALSWQPVSLHLAERGFRCAAIDLPGFGRESAVTNPTVEDTVLQVLETIRALRKGSRDEPLILAGHSMGGKFAMILASLANEHTEGLENLAGLLLVSPSPPSPEPMSESKRNHLLTSLGPGETDPDRRRSNAQKFLNENTGRLPLLPEVKDSATSDLLRMNPAAFAAWLEAGSKEDWSARGGRLSTPAVVFVGSEDAGLGADAQQEHTLPHLEHVTLVDLQGAGHLAPLERPAELAIRIEEFFHQIGVMGYAENAHLMSAMTELIHSDRTSPQTREALLKRLIEPEKSGIFSDDEFRTLRALVECVVPGAPFDLAARVDRALAQTVRDGWRFDRLPSDLQAWKQGLLSLDEAAGRDFKVPFIALDPARQERLLDRAAQGDLGKGLLGKLEIGHGKDCFDGDQMRDWFEDVRGELSRLYVSDPRTMQRIGFTGFADEHGFTNIRLSGGEEKSS